MDQTKKSSENENKKDDENLGDQQVATIMVPVKFQALKTVENVQSSYAKMLASIQVPDYTKMLGLQVLNYSKMLANIQMPDYSKMLANIQMPDYSKMLADVQIPDYSKMLAGIQATDPTRALGPYTFSSNAAMSEVLKNISTYHSSVLSEALKLTKICHPLTSREVNALRVPSVEEIEVLSLPAEDPRQIFPNLTPNLEVAKNLEELDSEVQSNYEISDFEINFKAYKFLCNLEIYLRNLITKRIIEPNKKNLNNRIPPDVLSRCEERKRQDTLNKYNLIDYSDFTDLKKYLITEKTRIYLKIFLMKKSIKL